MQYPSDIAFTDSVKTMQTRNGSRNAYAQMERGSSWPTELNPKLAEFIGKQRSFFLGTSNLAGQPYIQHRGGPPGFLHIINSRTLAFAELKGNRQYITHGNLAENPKAFIFLIDYSHQIRYKLWGTAQVTEGQSQLLSELTANEGGEQIRAEQVLLFTIQAWDQNCPQHIPRRIDVDESGK